MKAKKAVRHKHIPQRTCVGCREVLPKRAMVRIVRTPEGLRIDPTGKMAGRGAYLHERRSCWQAGLKGTLGRALHVELSPEDRRTLQSHMERLTDA